MYDVPMTPATAVFALGALTLGFAVVVGVLAWRARPRPGATWLSLLMGAVFWLVVCRLALYVSPTDAARAAWINLEWVGTGFIPAFWLLFALAYTGHDEYLRAPVVAAVAVVPALTALFSLTNASHNLMRVSFETVSVGGLTTVASVRGPWFWVYAAYAYTVAILCLALFVHNATTAARPYREQATLMVVAALVPLFSSLPSALGLTVFDPTPLGFAVTGGGALLAMGQYRFMDAVPVPRHVARDAVLEHMDSPVVVVDGSDRVVDHNPAAASLFGLDDEGTQAREAVPDYERLLVGDVGTVTVGVGKDRQVYDVEVSALDDTGHWTRGRVFVFTDVTERQRHLQRLSVFNRVLQHNIRNEMNLVAGYSDMIEDSGRPVEVVRERSHRVLELSRKARDTERIIDQATEAPRPETVDAVVHRAVSRVRDSVGEARVDVTVSDPNEVCDGLFEPVLVELIENAVLHGARNDAAGEESGTAPDTDSDAGPRSETAGADGETPVDHGATDADGDAQHPDDDAAATQTSSPADSGADGAPATADGAGAGGRVAVSASRSGERVVFRVADDGPGIPDHELAVLDNDVETALEHGSGFGLWLVTWGVEALGGTVSFDRPGDGGTVVTVTAPVLGADPGVR